MASNAGHVSSTDPHRRGRRSGGVAHAIFMSVFLAGFIAAMVIGAGMVAVENAAGVASIIVLVALIAGWFAMSGGDNQDA